MILVILGKVIIVATLYELIERVGDYIKIGSHRLYEYLIWTSEDTGGILRTCDTMRSSPLNNKEIRMPRIVVISVIGELSESSLTVENGIANAKLRVYYEMMDENNLDEIMQVNYELGYKLVYLVKV